jgi:hypothetical protein
MKSLALNDICLFNFLDIFGIFARLSKLVTRDVSHLAYSLAVYPTVSVGWFERTRLKRSNL